MKRPIVTHIGRGNGWTPATEMRVIFLHDAGHTPVEIAFRVKRKEDMIRDCLARHRLTPNPDKPPKNYHSPMGEGPPAERQASPEGENPVRVVEAVLGSRLCYRPTGERLLDGRACSLDEMMREGNRLLKERGHPQRGKNPAWLV